jgi:hypothetical protein
MGEVDDEDIAELDRLAHRWPTRRCGMSGLRASRLSWSRAHARAERAEEDRDHAEREREEVRGWLRAANEERRAVERQPDGALAQLAHEKRANAALYAGRIQAVEHLRTWQRQAGPGHPLREAVEAALVALGESPTAPEADP